MPRKNMSINADNIISEYLSNKSIKQIAADIGYSREIVYRVLRENNIAIRNRSESMYVRMAQTSPEERKRLALAANIAKRGTHNTPEMLHKRALAHQRRIGAFEKEFNDAIIAAGIETIPQEPFMSYNLDIGCGDIAVEIHTQKANPLTVKYVSKLMNCVNSGKSMIYVWIPPRNLTISAECYEKVISIIKEFRSNPPSRSKYWVIRSTGELYASGSFD